MNGHAGSSDKGNERGVIHEWMGGEVENLKMHPSCLVLYSKDLVDYPVLYQF